MKYCVPLLAVLCVLPAHAQDGRFTAHAGGGFTAPTFDTADRLDIGWNVLAGAGARLTRNLAILGEFNYNDFGIAGAVLRGVGVPDGDTRVWSFTANPRFTVNPRGRVNFYVTGGGGVYRRTVDFTRPTITTVTVFDPFFGLFYPVGVPAEEVIRSFSTTKGGLNAGGGFDVHLTRRSLKLFAEARYHHMFTSGVGTSFIPVTIGLCW